MGLKVRIKDGATFQFDDDKEVISFGRDKSKCDVHFPEDDTRVSSEHFALKRVLGTYQLVLGTKAVLVNNEEGYDGQKLDAVTTLRLSPTGPDLVVETVKSGTLPSTDIGGARPEGAHTKIKKTEQKVQSVRKIAIGAVVLAIVVGVVLTLRQEAAFGEIEKDLEVTRESIESGLDSAQSDAVDKLKARVQASEDRLKKMGEPLRAKIRAAVAKWQPSVYHVQTRGKGGGRRAGGTAWVVGPDLLATNAHVAVAFANKGPGETVVCRSNQDPHQDFEVVSITIHPGYAKFAELLANRSPISGSGGPISFIPACDVALMKVKLDGRSLGEPLDLVPADTVKTSLTAGMELGFVGYPSEAMAGGGINLERPEPTTQLGNLTAVTDYFVGRAAPEEEQLVQFNMPAAGGASGSPVFNAEGKVIAALNAGNFAMTAQGKRVPIGGVNFGQRVDLVHELLQGTAEAAMQARYATWQKRVDSLVRERAQSFAGGYEKFLITNLKKKNPKVDHLEELFAHEGAEESKAFTITQDGTYYALVISKVRAQVGIQIKPGDKPWAKGKMSKTMWSHWGFNAKKGWPLKFRAYSGSKTSVDHFLKLFRLVMK